MFGAHKLVLAAHFRSLRGLLTDPLEKKSFYRFFDALLRNVSPFLIPLYNCNNSLYRAVEAVLDYAYTGNIELTVGSAERIYLLAHNLKSKRLRKTCIQFLILK